MGKAVEEVAKARGHEIVLRIDQNTKDYNIKMADVAIEFSTPTSAFKNIENAIRKGVAVVSGTTGWTDRYAEIERLCREKNGSFLYSSNFSIGVNVFFELNKKLAQMMSKFKDYNICIEETHHIHKLDAPSGTAITLAEEIIEETDKQGWVSKRAKEDEIEIKSYRIGEVTGMHKVMYESRMDSIEITHTAHNREGFAIGAVMAAEWLKGREGVYAMRDVIFEK